METLGSWVEFKIIFEQCLAVRYGYEKCSHWYDGMEEFKLFIVVAESAKTDALDL